MVRALASALKFHNTHDQKEAWIFVFYIAVQVVYTHLKRSLVVACLLEQRRLCSIFFFKISRCSIECFAFNCIFYFSFSLVNEDYGLEVQVFVHFFF